MKTLVICDSRGRLLREMVGDETGVGKTEILAFPGAGYCRAVALADDTIKRMVPTLVIMMVGICDITKRDKKSKLTTLRDNNVDGIVTHVISQARRSWEILHSKNLRVSYATVSGLDLVKYNNHLDQRTDATIIKQLTEAQATLNEAILVINKRLIELNKETGLPTTWTASYVHQYFRKKYHHYYNRLVDGCHPTRQAAEYWTKQIAKTIIQTH